MRRIDLLEQINKPHYIQRYREVTITNNETSDLSDFQILIEIGGDFLNKANPNNLIIVDSENVVYPYWVEQWKCSSGEAKIWTKVDLAASGSKILKLYYDGIVGENLPNGDDVFDFFDDFDGNDLDTNKWSDISGSWDVSNSLLLQTDTSEGHHLLKAAYTTQSNEIYEMYGKVLDNATHENYIGISHRCADNDNFYAFYLTSVVDLTNSGNRWGKNVSGAWSLVAEAVDDYGHDIDVFYKLKLRKVGDTFTFYVNGDQKFSSSDTSLSADAFGIWMYNNKAKCDYIFVRKYTANEPFVSVGDEQIIYR